jgi:hypothetical protein
LASTEIATDGDIFLYIHEDASGRASIHTFSATGANLLVNGHESHGVFSDKCINRTGFHTRCFLTLLANKGKGLYQTVSLPPYYTNGGSIRIALAEMVKRAYDFTFFAPRANLMIH